MLGVLYVFAESRELWMSTTSKRSQICPQGDSTSRHQNHYTLPDEWFIQRGVQEIRRGIVWGVWDYSGPYSGGALQVF